MARFGLVGGTYQSQAPNADAELTVNWYPETIESPDGKSAMALYPRMGLVQFATLAGEPNVPRLFSQNGRVFAAGLFFWEVLADGTAIKRGSLNPAKQGPIFITANQNQILTCSGGKLYLYDLATNALTAVAMGQFNGPISWVGFVDGFFVALQSASQVFYVSNLLDGAVWQAVNAEQVSQFTDNIVSMIASHDELAICGSKASLIYYNSGALLSPFVPLQGAFIEQGSVALAGMVNMDNAVFWAGQDERGQMVAWRNNAYTPVRVSNHGVEQVWSTYATVSDLVSWSMQDRGHTFWVMYFPTANATWVYDAATGMWTQWDYWDPQRGSQAFRGICHCMGFGKHLVGDWKTGSVLQMTASAYTDVGSPIYWRRRSPHVSVENEWMRHNSLELDLETGVGPEPPLQGQSQPTSLTLMDASGALRSVVVSDFGLLTTRAWSTGMPLTAQSIMLNNQEGTASFQLGVDIFGLLIAVPIAFTAGLPTFVNMVSLGGTEKYRLQVNFIGSPQSASDGHVARGPLVYLRWSDDSCHTWSNLHAKDAGQAGKFKTRVVWRRLGRARTRTYEVSCSDPVPWRLIEAYLKSTKYETTERMSSMLRKGA